MAGMSSTMRFLAARDAAGRRKRAWERNTPEGRAYIAKMAATLADDAAFEQARKDKIGEIIDSCRARYSDPVEMAAAIIRETGEAVEKLYADREARWRAQ